ncbi:MAG TPA: hypothetical protein ENG52_03885, partial [Nitrososphaeria archaeon]|nr:hypothetical protein [Nitrososphaeria archaeon]
MHSRWEGVAEAYRSLPQRARLSLLKLRISMIGIWAVVTGLATLILAGVLLYLGMPLYGLYGILGF